MPSNNSWELPRANSIFDDARDALTSLRGLRNRSRNRDDFRPITEHDEYESGHRYIAYINKEGQKTYKRVKNIVFGPIGRRALVGDDFEQGVA